MGAARPVPAEQMHARRAARPSGMVVWERWPVPGYGLLLGRGQRRQQRGTERGSQSVGGRFCSTFFEPPRLARMQGSNLANFQKRSKLEKASEIKKKGARRSEHTVTVAPLFGQPQRLGVKSRGLGPPPLRRRRRGPDLPERRRPPPRSAAICAAISL